MTRLASVLTLSRTLSAKRLYFLLFCRLPQPITMMINLGHTVLRRLIYKFGFGLFDERGQSLGQLLNKLVLASNWRLL